MNAPVNNEKYDSILKTSHDLFWKFGIKRVTIEEICREANVSKMTFYRFFPNKTELAKMVLLNLFEEMRTEYKKLMDEDIPFEEKVRKQLIMKFEGTMDISPELVKDIYIDSESEIFELWRGEADQMFQLVYEDYAKAQEKGWIRKEINLDFIFYMWNKTIEMASDQKLVALYPDMQSLIMEIANFFFYGILPHPDKK